MVDLVEIELTLLLLTVNIAVITWLAGRLTRNRFKTFITDTIDEIIEDKMSQIAENPSIIKPIVAPLLKALAKEFGIPEGQGAAKSINLFGWKIPPQLLEIGMRFLGGKVEQAASGENPFG